MDTALNTNPRVCLVYLACTLEGPVSWVSTSFIFKISVIFLFNTHDYEISTGEMKN